MHNEYIVFVDHRFSKIVERELASLPNCTIEAYKVRNNRKLNTLFFKVLANNSIDFEKVSKASAFIDFVIGVDFTLQINTLDYQKIEEAIAKIINDSNAKTFKIEVKKIDFSSNETAKSIEVRLGRELEKRGYIADLNNPELIIYCLLLRNAVILGQPIAGSKRIVLDLFRQANKEKEDFVNRAEYKLKEAVEAFGIDLSMHKIALDIGAAPGGWSHYLLQHGVKVVAVDNALLDYKKFIGKKMLVITNEKEKLGLDKIENVSIKEFGEEIEIGAYDLIHIKTNVLNEQIARLLNKLGKFDMLTIDTNTAPLESASIANKLAGFLTNNAVLVMTIKLISKAFSKHISEAVDELSKNYGFAKVKKLPHNRQEVTLFATKKA
ncbi:MAG: THUMP domain-containing class I SAM-dependent methyltransferase [Candidatus Micrarchaeota archaeon]